MYVLYFGIFGMCGIKQKSLIYQGLDAFFYIPNSKFNIPRLEYFETVRSVYVVGYLAGMFGKPNITKYLYITVLR